MYGQNTLQNSAKNAKDTTFSRQPLCVINDYYGVVSSFFISVNYRYKRTAYYTVVIITGIKSVVEKGTSL